MALSPNRHIDGSELLECLMLIPSEIGYKFFSEAPKWFFNEIAEFLQSKGTLIPSIMAFIKMDVDRVSNSKRDLNSYPSFNLNLFFLI